ncbi:MAG TPA: hypothetical protein VGR19_13015 [Allosphingosinicella sp.]|nr:hypothetical protein [Allosphingosinicella sp.]
MKHLHRAALVAAMLTVPAATALAQDNSTAGTTSTVNTAAGTAGTQTTTTTGTTGEQLTTDPAVTGTTGTDTTGTLVTDPNLSDPAATTVGTDPVDMTTVDTGFETNEQFTQVRREEDNDFPWGLLGLLGLAGLMGGRKKHASDIHVDARHDNR